MSLKLYMDVDVLTAQEDGATRLPDPELLDRATSLQRVLVTQDDDLLGEATRRQASGEPFAGVIYAHQLKVTIGQCIRDLSLIAEAGEPADMASTAEFLPLK